MAIYGTTMSEKCCNHSKQCHNNVFALKTAIANCSMYHHHKNLKLSHMKPEQ